MPILKSVRSSLPPCVYHSLKPVKADARSIQHNVRLLRLSQTHVLGIFGPSPPSTENVARRDSGGLALPPFEVQDTTPPKSYNMGDPDELPFSLPPSDKSYFDESSPPETLGSHAELAKAFISHHLRSDRAVVLVTSGGTTVPLENQTVRFIDNFSAGTRGATSAEYFLEAGYAVIFLHRQFSLLPYSRHYSHSTNCFLDYMTEGQDSEVVVNPEYREKMLGVLRKYNAARRNNTLLLLPFTTITEYLWELRMISMLMRPLGPKALFYLAAAVSDFFVPRDRLSEHKIQSSQTNEASDDVESESSGNTKTPRGKQLMVNLDPVPKFLKSLVDGWAPEGMIVSFKLETDPSLLEFKAQQALEKYSHHLVIGNLLSTRKFEVVFVAPAQRERWIRVPIHRRVKSVSGTRPTIDAVSNGNLPEQEWMNGDLEQEIESLIVPEVAKLHRSFTQRSQQHKEEDEEELLAKALAWAEFGSAD